MVSFAFPLRTSIPAQYFVIYDEREPNEKIEREIQALRHAIAYERAAEPYPSTLDALWADAPAQFRRAGIYDEIIPAAAPNLTYELDLDDADMELDREAERSIHSSTSLRAEPIQESLPVMFQGNESTATSSDIPKFNADCSPSQLIPSQLAPATAEETDEDATSSEDSIYMDSSRLSTPASTGPVQLPDSISPNSVTCRLPTSHGQCMTILTSLHDVRIHIREKKTAHLIPVRMRAPKYKGCTQVGCPWPGCTSSVTPRTLEGHVLLHMVHFVCPVSDCKSKKSKSGGAFGYRDSLRFHLAELHGFEKPSAYIDRFAVLRAEHFQSHPM